MVAYGVGQGLVSRMALPWVCGSPLRRAGWRTALTRRSRRSQRPRREACSVGGYHVVLHHLREGRRTASTQRTQRNSERTRRKNNSKRLKGVRGERSTWPDATLRREQSPKSVAVRSLRGSLRGSFRGH